MITCALPETCTRPAVVNPRASSSSTSVRNTVGSMTQPAPMMHVLPVTTPLGIWRILYVSLADDDRVPCVRAALVAAHEIRVLREQVDDLALAFVSPLRADDDCRWHLRKCRAGAGLRASLLYGP